MLLNDRAYSKVIRELFSFSVLYRSILLYIWYIYNFLVYDWWPLTAELPTLEVGGAQRDTAFIISVEI